MVYPFGIVERKRNGRYETRTALAEPARAPQRMESGIRSIERVCTVDARLYLFQNPKIFPGDCFAAPS